MKKVFIIVLNWNGYRDTVDCLRSIEKCSYTAYEVVVVDNGSTDGSVERLKKDFKDVVYIENKENLGYTGGNNVGIKYAMDRRGEFIWLLNNDTLIESDSLDILIRAAKDNPYAGVLSPK